jgi:hypothetical protein
VLTAAPSFTFSVPISATSESVPNSATVPTEVGFWEDFAAAQGLLSVMIKHIPSFGYAVMVLPKLKNSGMTGGRKLKDLVRTS